MPPAPRTRVTLSVVEQITDQVIEMVLSGELEPGQSLPINELASQLGVSHIPVREALRRLERDGLIMYTRGKGATVAPVSAEDLTDVFRLRSVIELDVGRRSAKLLDDEHLRRAASQFAELDAAMRGSRPGTISPSHREFHYALLPAASPWDRRMLDQLWMATERYIQLHLGSVRPLPRAVDEIMEAHAALLEAATTRQPRIYVKALAEHNHWSERELLPAFNERMRAAAAAAASA